MGNYPSTVEVKVFTDKRNNKVIFAEANEDFVEILFSFFTLPLGTIARHSSNSHLPNPNIKVGSLSSLYDSALMINITPFSDKLCKDMLSNPINSSAALCEKLKINLNSNNKNASVESNHGEAVLVKEKRSFIITDDLHITPFFVDRCIELRDHLGVEGHDFLCTYLQFDLNKFVNLLKLSLVTNNPLTTLVNGGSKPSSPCSSCIEDATLDNLPLFFSNSAQPRSTVKLLIHKSKKKVLCAEVDHSFVEMLLSFLTIPLGAVKVLTDDTSFPVCINNLYKSISTLGDENYLKSDDILNMLLSPKLASIYFHATDLLPIYEKGIPQGTFLKEHTAFIVSDDLKIKLPSFSTFWKYTGSTPVDDIKVVEVSIGEQQALNILKASLTSTTALTDCLNGFWKNSKEKLT